MTSSDSIKVRSTSSNSAIATDIVLRIGERSRLVFRPEIVNNPHNARACVRGTFVYQRKGQTQLWEDVADESLTRLKKGEGYKLDIKPFDPIACPESAPRDQPTPQRPSTGPRK